MKTTRNKQPFYYLLNGVRYRTQTELAEVLKANPSTISTKLYTAKKQKHNFIEVNNNFVRVLTPKEAYELALTINFV